jgi:hypothetical protein
MSFNTKKTVCMVFNPHMVKGGGRIYPQTDLLAATP